MSILWVTPILDQPHIFTFLTLNSFLHPFLNQNFGKKSFESKLFHFRRPIFINQFLVFSAMEILDLTSEGYLAY